MPLKLNIGLSRKVGEANYGSRGASVNMEVEIESALAGEPDKLHDKIRKMFTLVRNSLEENCTAPTATKRRRWPFACTPFPSPSSTRSALCASITAIRLMSRAACSPSAWSGRARSNRAVSPFWGGRPAASRTAGPASSLA
jgi:hypothetical protein